MVVLMSIWYHYDTVVGPLGAVPKGIEMRN